MRNLFANYCYKNELGSFYVYNETYEIIFNKPDPNRF